MIHLNQHHHSNHLLHVLFEQQQRARFISDQAIEDIAARLHLPHAQVVSVVEFYAFFYRSARGKFHLLFSNCCSCGDLALMQRLCRLLQVKPAQTRADGLVTIADASCIGMCDHGPSLLINGITLVGLSTARIDQMAELIESDTALAEWPAAWFHVDDHVRKNGLLLAEPFESGSALKKVMQCSSDEILDKITASELKGRGGAGFPTGSKWRFCRDADDDCRYVVCNADEGEPGTFKDRVLLNSHADMVFEGMTICARAISASHGYLYLRAEYRYMLNQLEHTLQQRRQAGLLGENILGDGFNFDIDIVVGAGAYICGEESALLESIEQKRGIPRVRPPFPVTHGLWGKPTVINNVETLAAATKIMLHGQQWFQRHGTWQSKGSKLLSISGDCARPGIYEVEFGISIQQILDDAGAVDVQAVQVGGPAGQLLAPDHFEHSIAFEDIATGGSFIIFNQQRDLLAIISSFSHFFAHESCGFCTPCRVGTRLLKNGMNKLCIGHATARDLHELQHTAALVGQHAHCGLGATAANPINDGLKSFPELFEQKLLHKEMEPEFDLDAALQESRQLTKRDDAEAHL